MSDELFPIEDVLMDSPKLKWLKEHRISTKCRADLKANGYDGPLWEAYVGDYDDAVDDVADSGDWSQLIQLGNTERHALEEIARANRWDLWDGA